jgi:hypothetical protein
MACGSGNLGNTRTHGAGADHGHLRGFCKRSHFC